MLLLAVALCTVPAVAFSVEGDKEHAPVIITMADENNTEAYTINHGPYLQGVTYDGATVVFTTSHKGFSKVEVRKKGSSESRICDSRRNGLIMADNTHNVIDMLGLEPATEYEYRIVSKRVVDFKPYKVTFGEEITSEWYSFRTFDPKAKEFTFAVLNDIHDDSKKCSDLLDIQPIDEVGMVFYNGDILSHYSEQGQPFSSFIDVSVEKFAKHKPFAVVRGNHETRGHFATSYLKYFPTSTGMPYYTLKQGDVFFILLDGGEDKPDSNIEYYETANYDQYRLEEAEWLKKVLQSDECKNAKHRIVLMHMPPLNGNKMWHGPLHAAKCFLPLLNEANIDVMLCGHTHKYSYNTTPDKTDAKFPVLVNSNGAALKAVVNEEGIKIEVINTEGVVEHTHKF